MAVPTTNRTMMLTVSRRWKRREVSAMLDSGCESRLGLGRVGDPLDTSDLSPADDRFFLRDKLRQLAQEEPRRLLLLRTTLYAKLCDSHWRMSIQFTTFFLSVESRGCGKACSACQNLVEPDARRIRQAKSDLPRLCRLAGESVGSLIACPLYETRRR